MTFNKIFARAELRDRKPLNRGNDLNGHKEPAAPVALLVRVRVS